MDNKKEKRCWLVIDKFGPWPGNIQYVCNSYPELGDPGLIVTGPFPLGVSYNIESPYDDLNFLDQTPPCECDPSKPGNICSCARSMTTAEPAVQSATDTSCRHPIGTGVPYRPSFEKELLVCPICKTTPNVINGQVMGHNHSGEMVDSYLCSPNEWNKHCQALGMEKCPTCGERPNYNKEKDMFVHNYEDPHVVCVKAFHSEQEWKAWCENLRCQNFRACPKCGKKPVFHPHNGFSYHCHPSEVAGQHIEFFVHNAEEWEDACEEMLLDKEGKTFLEKAEEVVDNKMSIRYIIKHIRRQERAKNEEQTTRTT